MPFTIRPYRRFPVCYILIYASDPFQWQGNVWNLSRGGSPRLGVL
jgi:hypothetical protein